MRLLDSIPELELHMEPPDLSAVGDTLLGIICMTICLEAVDRLENSDRRRDLSFCLSKIVVEIIKKGENSQFTVFWRS